MSKQRCYRRVSYGDLLHFGDFLVESLLREFDIEHLIDAEIKEVKLWDWVRAMTYKHWRSRSVSVDAVEGSL